MRRQSQGFSRGTSTYRGVSPHPSGALRCTSDFIAVFVVLPPRAGPPRYVESAAAATCQCTAAKTHGLASRAGRFEARIGIAGNKHVYLGLYNKEAEAAKAYDQAVVRIKGSQASTNFSLSDYARELTEHELKQARFLGPSPSLCLRLFCFLVCMLVGVSMGSATACSAAVRASTRSMSSKHVHLLQCIGLLA